MAWTTPRTWTDNELENAAIFNTHVRDNFNAIGPIMRVRKTADETLASNTTLQDDNHLTFAIAASEVWLVELRWMFNVGAAAMGFKCAWSVPSGATGHWYASWHDSNSTQVMGAGRRTPPTVYSPTVNAAGDYELTVYATIVNSTNAGNVTWQWAQATSNGNNLTSLTNSVIVAHRI